MEDFIITPSVEKFLKWYCLSQKKLFNNEFTEEKLVSYLKGDQSKILAQIKLTLETDLLAFKKETNLNLLKHKDSLDLCKKIEESLKRYFLPAPACSGADCDNCESFETCNLRKK